MVTFECTKTHKLQNLGGGLNHPHKNSNRRINLKLTVFERIILQNILPAEGDYITLKLIRKLRESLSFSEKEIADIDFKNRWNCEACKTSELAVQTPKCPSCGAYMQPAGSVHWDEGKALNVIKDVHMGRTMRDLCVSTLKKLSDEQKLTEQHMSLYEKFVEGEEEDDEDEQPSKKGKTK